MNWSQTDDEMRHWRHCLGAYAHLTVADIERVTKAALEEQGSESNGDAAEFEEYLDSF